MVKLGTLALILGLLAVPSALGQPQEVAIIDVQWDEVEVGLIPGRVIPDAHNPYHITITNDFQDFEGTLEITVATAMPPVGRLPRIRYERPLELPRGSRKSFSGTFFCPADATELTIRLVEESGREFALSAAGFGQIDLSNRLVMAIDNPTARWDGLQISREAIPGLRRQILYRSPARVPDSWAALAPLTTILWDGVRWPQTDSAQAEALRQWIERGGVMAIGSGPVRPQLLESPLADLLPFPLGETTTVPGGQTTGEISLAVGNPLPIAPVDEEDLPPNARVLSRLGEHPLLIDLPRGNGHIVLCTARLESLWSSLPAQGRRTLSLLLVPPGAPSIPHSTDPELTIARSALTRQARVRVPDAQTIGLWLLALWIIMVPANFALARATRRKRMAWLLVPIIAIVATGFIWHRGGQGLPFHEVRQTHLVSCEPGAQTVPLRGLLTLTALRRDSFTATLRDPMATISSLGTGQLIVDASDVLSLRGESPAGLVGYTVNARSFRQVAVHAQIPNPLPADLHVQRQGNDVTWDAPLSALARIWCLQAGRQMIRIPDEQIWTAGSISIPSDLDEEHLLSEESLPSEEAILLINSLAHGDPQATDWNSGSELRLIGYRPEAFMGVEFSSREEKRIPEISRRGMALLIIPISFDRETTTPGETMHWTQWHMDATPPADWTASFIISGGSRALTIPSNCPEDLTLVFHPQGSGWGEVSAERFDLGFNVRPLRGGRRAALIENEAEAAMTVALFDWQTQSWTERMTSLGSKTLSWENPSDFLHPLTGDVVAAVWALHPTSVSTTVGPSMDDSTPESTPWYAGPNRKRNMSLFTGDQVVLTSIAPQIHGFQQPPPEGDQP